MVTTLLNGPLACPGATVAWAPFGQSYMGASQYMIACNDPMPPSLGAMVPVSAAADYHEGWVYHTGGAMLWGWAVPYAIHKGRNTLERKGRHDLLTKMDEVRGGRH